MAAYDYRTPPGFGDTFYQYVFDAQSQSPVLTNGVNYSRLGIQVVDGDFILRHWAGLDTIADRLQIYDWLGRGISDEPMFLGAAANNVFAHMVVAPEIKFPVNGNIRFDLINVTQAVAGTDGALTVYRSQLVFSGARRRLGVIGDPVPSAYPFYEKPYYIPYQLSITQYASASGLLNAPQVIQIAVEDFDFELRRIELRLQSSQQASPFKMTLYNSDKVAMSNAPILSNMLLHLDPRQSSGEMSFWPCPPILYRANSTIRFDVHSLLFSPTVLPQTYSLLFHGVRRIPC